MRARRTALATEITAAEKDLEATAAQVQAKEAEKETAERRVAALKRQAKGNKKGGSGDQQRAEGELARLDQELDGLKIDHEDKELRLTQLRQERDAPSCPRSKAREQRSCLSGARGCGRTPPAPLATQSLQFFHRSANSTSSATAYQGLQRDLRLS